MSESPGVELRFRLHNRLAERNALGASESYVLVRVRQNATSGGTDLPRR